MYLHLVVLEKMNKERIKKKNSSRFLYKRKLDFLFFRCISMGRRREKERIDNSRKFEGKSNFPTILVPLIENNEIRFCIDQRLNIKGLNIKLKFD